MERYLGEINGQKVKNMIGPTHIDSNSYFASIKCMQTMARNNIRFFSLFGSELSEWWGPGLLVCYHSWLP